MIASGNIENRNTNQHKMGRYKGKVIILSNHYNASAGETTLAKIKSSMSNSIVIGENSCGAFVFSSKNSYCLKNSLIKLQLTKWLEIQLMNFLNNNYSCLKKQMHHKNFPLLQLNLVLKI